MLDSAYVRDHIETVRAGLRSRGIDPDKALEEIATFETARRRLIPELEGLKRLQNTSGDEIARAARINNWTVGVAGGLLEGTFSKYAADLGKARPRQAQGSSRLEPRLSATGPRSPGVPRTLKRPSSRRRWATAPEGRAGRGRIEPNGETQERTSP